MSTEQRTHLNFAEKYIGVPVFIVIALLFTAPFTAITLLAGLLMFYMMAPYLLLMMIGAAVLVGVVDSYTPARKQELARRKKEEDDLWAKRFAKIDKRLADEGLDRNAFYSLVTSRLSQKKDH